MGRGKIWTQEECSYLLLHYTESQDLRSLAQKFNTTPNAVRSKANRLGFSRKNKRIPWSDAELDLLEAWAETKPFADLVQAWQRKARKLGWAKRSPEAIKKQLHKMGATSEPQVGWYKASALRAGLEASQWTIQSWLSSGKLKAQKKGDGIHADYLISEKALADFALKYPAEVSERITPDGMCWLLQVINAARNPI